MDICSFAMSPVVVLALVLCCSLTVSGKSVLPEIESKNVKPANQIEEDIDSKLDASPDKFTQQLEEDYENEMDASANNFRKELEDDDENEMDASANNFRKQIEDDENEMAPTANDFNKQLEKGYENEMDASAENVKKQLEDDYGNEMDTTADKSTNKPEDDYVHEMANYDVLAGESKNLLSAEANVDESSGASGGRPCYNFTFHYCSFQYYLKFSSITKPGTWCNKEGFLKDYPI